MSLLKTQPTDFHETEKDVKYKQHYIRIDGIDEPGFPNLIIRSGFRGRVVGTDGVVNEFNAPSLSRQDVIDNFSAEEKAAGKLFIAAVERESALKDERLKEETQDADDVFA